MLCTWRRSPGKERLRLFAATRLQGLQKALNAEVVALKQEAEQGVGAVHPQCLKDFDRADFALGDTTFEQGAAARSGTGADSVNAGRALFEKRLREECKGFDDGFLRVVSALLSQIAMAHLAAVCFSGPHSYALPGGSVKALYSLQREGSIVHIRIERVARDLKSFSLPDGDETACSPDSYVRQFAEFTLEQRPGNAGSIGISVEEASESIRLVWPDGDLVTHDGLTLDFVSPAKGRVSQVIHAVLQLLMCIAERFLPVIVSKHVRAVFRLRKEAP